MAHPIIHIKNRLPLIQSSPACPLQTVTTNFNSFERAKAPKGESRRHKARLHQLHRLRIIKHRLYCQSQLHQLEKQLGC